MQKTKKSTKKHVLIIAALIIAMLGIVFSIGKFISAPWELSTTLNNIFSENYGNNYGVIVDKEGGRLSLLDKDQKLTNIKNSYTTEGELYFFSNTQVADNEFYVHEFSYIKDTHFLSKEKISKYNRDGSKVSDLATYSYNLNDNVTNIPRIRSLSLADSKLYYTYQDSGQNTYTINSINLDTDEMSQESALMQSFPDPTKIEAAYQIAYNSSNNKLSVIDSFGNVYLANIGDISFTKTTKNILGENNQTEKLWSSPYLLLSQNDEAQLNNVDTVNFSLLLSARIIYFWLSLLFLVGFIVYCAVMFVKQSDKAKLWNKLRMPTLIALLIVIAISIISYININNKNIQLESFNEILSQNVLLLKESNNQEIVEFINYDENLPDYTQKFKEANATLLNTSLISAKTSMTANYALYKVENGEYKHLVNSTFPSMTGAYAKKKIFDNDKLSDAGVYTSTLSNISGNYEFAATPISDNNGKIIGVLTCYRNLDTGENLINSSTIMMMIGIATALITLSFLIMETVSWIKGLAMRRKKNAAEQVKEYSLTSPIYCLSNAASAADATIGVIVFQNMLVGTLFEGNTLVISLPLTFKVLGNIAGVMLFPKIVKRLGVKHTLLLAAVGTCICFAGCSLAVFASKILLLSLVLFLASFFKELLWMYLNDAPVHITDSSKRKEINNKCSASGICGSAIITILVGYASESIGDWCVYICAAIPVVIIFVMVLFLMPKLCALDKQNKLIKQKNTRSNIREVFSFLLRRDIVTMLISALAITIFLGGYKTFIFPLLANSSGMSNSDVSNISVFASALTYYITPLFTSIQKKAGTFKTLVEVELIVGVLFILFIFNGSFLWACIVYIVTQILIKFMYPSINDYWQSIVQKTNTNSNIAVTGMSVVSNLFNLTKNPLMGALMGVGSVFACVIIGIYSIISCGVFGVSNVKQHSDNKSDDKERL